MRTRTRYARNGEVSLAYEVFGEGERDILVTFGWVGSFDSAWRAGLHTGECEALDGDIQGIAVNIGARVGGEAQPGEVLVSQTVKDLVAGSGFNFEDRGERELKGVPGSWRLYAVGQRGLSSRAA